MSLHSPKKDNNLKYPLHQGKGSPLSTSRGANMVTSKSPSSARPSPNIIKPVNQRQSQRIKPQNTSIKVLQQKLGQLGSMLASIKTEPTNKQSPSNKQREALKCQNTKKNCSAIDLKKSDPLIKPGVPYRKQVVRKTCPDVAKAFETSKMLLNPSDLINPRNTTDKIQKTKMTKIRAGDPYQMIDLANGCRRSFKFNNLEIKKPQSKLQQKVENKKNIKSNEHSSKNLSSLQKAEAKMRATMSNNLLTKTTGKKEIKVISDDSNGKIQNKTMEESAQSLPEMEPHARKDVKEEKRVITQIATSTSLIPSPLLKQQMLQYTNQFRLSCLSPQNKQSLALNPSPSVSVSGTNIDEFQMLKELGSGKFSVVYLAAHKKTGFLLAIKQISKEKVKKLNMIRQVTDEIKLHSCLSHPNIIKFYGLLQDSNSLYLLLEFIEGGSLFDQLSVSQKMNVKQASTYLRDVISAIQYLHDKHIAHRDIKPENILISMGCLAKICDLGWSAVILTSRKTYCGTFDYVPPEILEKKDYDLSVDIWCLGILTYELLIGKVPYEGDKHTVVMSKINNVQISYPDVSGEFPAQAKSYIQWLLRHNPQERPKSMQLLEHQFFEISKQQSKPKQIP